MTRWLVRLVLLGSTALAGCSGDPIPIDEPSMPPGDPPLGELLPIDEELRLEGLRGPVDAVRDVHGRMHIYATHLADAALVQGYLVARDRHVQLEFLRRAAVGRLAEMLGAFDGSLLNTDIGFRHIGLARTGAAMYAQADPELKMVADAYASGISQLYAEIRSGERPLVDGITVVSPEVFEEWKPEDSFAVGRLQTWLLAYSGGDEIAGTGLMEDFRETFSAADPDPAVAARAGMERDYMRFAPLDPATTIPGIGAIGGQASTAPPDGATAPVPATTPDPKLRQLIAGTDVVREGLERVRDMLAPTGFFGSNNWAVGPERSATGHALLASDPHLSLSSPAVFWPVSIHVRHTDEADRALDVEAGGIAFPGIPLIILGHNEHVAWGATVAAHDVTDVYRETLTADGEAVIFQGQEVALETITEEIDDGKGGTVTYDVKVVPHHGPIVPTIVDGEVQPLDPEMGALSVRWTGLVPTGELRAVANLIRARNVTEARRALDDFGVGGQNWMLADDAGNIGWTSHALVPYRDEPAFDWDSESYTGQLPCLILPGDGSAEWTGFWADDAVPWTENPLDGYIATANNDPLGGTLDDDPSDDLQGDGNRAYLGCTYDVGFRQGRIQRRIETFDGPIDLDGMSAIQADHRSPAGAALAPTLLLGVEAALAEYQAPGTYPDIADLVASSGVEIELLEEIRAMLLDWEAFDDFNAASGVNPEDGSLLPLDTVEGRGGQATLLFNTWFVRMAGRVFGDEMVRLGRPNMTGGASRALVHLLTADPANLATYDPNTGDSAVVDDLDTTGIETRRERIVRALFDAIAYLEAEVGPVSQWRWGNQHSVTFDALAPIFGKLVIPPGNDETFPDGFPRHGDLWVVDASSYRHNRAIEADIDFSYSSGPTQRFVVEMTPQGPKARNALPGGAVWDAASPYHRNQAEEWRRNQVHELPWVLDDVVAAAAERTVVFVE